jgi:hypothetical protein
MYFSLKKAFVLRRKNKELQEIYKTKKKRLLMFEGHTHALLYFST